MPERLSITHNPRIERMELMFDSLVSSQILIFIGGLILSFALIDQVDTKAILFWFSLLLISVVYRLALKYLYDAKSAIKAIEIKKWEHKYLFGVFLSAVVWGSAGIFLFAENSIAHQTILELTLAVICIVALRVLAPMKRAMVIFLPVVIIPISFSIAWSDNPVGLPMTGLVLVYFIVSFISGLRFNRNFNENQKLRFEAIEREHQLQESEEKYRLLYEKSEDAMLIISGNHIVMVNRATLELFGCDHEDQILQVDPFNLTPKYQADGQLSYQHVVQIKAIVYRKGYCRFEWLYKKTNGKVYPADVTLTSIPYEGKQAVFCILRDISKSKKVEHELMVAQQNAEIASQAKSAFLANMSHEIRTPMNGVLGTIDLLLRNELPEEQRLRGEIIKRSAESLLSIINDILDISKIEAGKFELKMAKFEMTALIEEFSSSIYSRIKAKNLVFKCTDNSAKKYWYIGDSGRIVQVLNNLVGNALKFTEQGSISLNYKVIKENETEAVVKFEVSDTGIGIKQALQEVLFNRFTQGDETTTRKHGGTGLGLNISKQLTHLMGGDIGVVSQPTEGSHFWFTVKLEKTQPELIEPNNSMQQEMKNFTASVLVVDDNSTNQYVAKSILESMGLHVDLAENGRLAIMALEQKNYDLVFMDCQMPVMDGYDATKAIRDRHTQVNNHEIPVIAMTASAMKGDRENCLAAGMNDYITKPIDIKVIEGVLETWLAVDEHQKPENQPELSTNSDTDELIRDTLVFDYPALYKRLSGDHELIRTIIHKFLKSMGLYIENIHAAVDDEDYEAIALSSHTLVGSAITVACVRISEIASKIELASKNQDMKTIKKFAELLKPNYENTQEVVKLHLSELS